MERYYPFGLGMKGLDYTAPSPNRENKWQFNGKEKQTELGLNHYDFGARGFDYQINRTTTLDPHADRYVNVSPYSFLNNNPLRFIDPTGRDVEDGFNEDGTLHRGTAYEQMKAKDDRAREKNRENKGKSNNVILTFFDAKTQEGAYEGSEWSVFSDKEDMNGKYGDGIKVNVFGLQAASLFVEFWTKTYGKMDNLVIATHGGTNKIALVFSYGVTLFATDFIPKFSKSPYVAHLKAITDLVRGPVEGKKGTGNVVFLACYAGRMHEVVSNYLNSNRDGKINIFMNKDYTTINGNHDVGYRVPLDTWLTQDHRYELGWINATTGVGYANLMIRKDGTILLKIMLKNKIFNYFLMIVLPACMGEFQSPQSLAEPTIGEIYEFAKNIPSIDSTRKVVHWMDYQFFDFNTLTPKDSTNIKRKDYFKVGYDYSRKIISIKHIENEWHLGNFEMFFYYHSKFVLAIVKSFDHYKEGSFLDGFFVIYPSQKKSYFISLQKLYFNDEIARVGFVNENKNFNLGNLEDISVVMILDEHFFAKYIFRISFGRLLFVSEPVYSHKGNLRLLFEHLWSYNCSENFNISPQSQLKDFDKIIEKDCLYWIAAARPPFNSNYCFPLWENSGKYEYRMTFDEEYDED